jgi:aldehyde:ferredoxin oxidoreductase
MKGYAGKILHVNLTSGLFTVEEPQEEFYRMYIGGSSLGTYYVMKGMVPGTDPLSPGSVLVFSVGPIAGSNISGAARHAVTGKSPQTGGIMASEAGGYWAPDFKRAGFDAVVITGKSEKPVYLFIHDKQYEICSAASIWGTTTKEAQEIIRKEHGDAKIRVVQIGRSGENLCNYACIVNELAHFNGRGGLGAVMGSKNLRAVAVRGTNKPDFFDNEGMQAFARKGIEKIKNSTDLQDFKQNGTHNVVIENIGLGGLPTRNWTSGVFEAQDELLPSAWNQAIIKPGTCYGCAQSCKRHIDGKKTDSIDPDYGGPEYETVAMCGSNLGISDKTTICKINEIAAKYAFDTISFGATLGFVMECYEQGIISTSDTDGYECNFGNIETAVQLAELTGRGEGFGKMLAMGSEPLADHFGCGSNKLLITSKKKEFPAHMPQSKAALALTYALVPFGSDHISIEMDPCISTLPLSKEIKALGFDRAEDPMELNDEKAKLFWRTQCAYSMMDTVCVCILAMGFGMTYTLDDIVEAVNFATGWETNLYELMMAGERRLHLMRAFNVKEGFSNEDDVLPEKMFTPITGGMTDGAVIDKERFFQTREFYYDMAGWTGKNNAPSASRLKSVNLDWVLDYLKQ